MKQQSPLRKEDKWRRVDFSQIHNYLNRPTAANIDAQRRSTDQLECEERMNMQGEGIEDLRTHNPLQEICQGLLSGLGIGAAVVTVIAMFLGSAQTFTVSALVTVMCMLGYLYLDDE